MGSDRTTGCSTRYSVERVHTFTRSAMCALFSMYMPVLPPAVLVTTPIIFGSEDMNMSLSRK